jgi:hypothetical protein
MQMTERPSSSEKRKFPRLKDSCVLRYRKVEADTLPEDGIDALTVNISGGGICFSSPSKVEVGALLAIELTLPDFNSAVVSFGRTVWCEPGEDGKYQVGLEFWWIGWGDDGAQKAITDYIKNTLES